MNETIPLKDCVDKGFYRVAGRNISFGIFVTEWQRFIGIRQKFGHEYLETEEHAEKKQMGATAYPKKLLSMCPIEDMTMYRDIEVWVYGKLEKQYQDNKELLDWIKQESEKFKSELD
jgi:hypothetical protein